MDLKTFLDLLVKYLLEYDMFYGRYRESELEGLGVGIDIFDYMLRDGIISKSEHKEYYKKLTGEDPIDDNL